MKRFNKSYAQLSEENTFWNRLRADVHAQSQRKASCFDWILLAACLLSAAVALLK